MTVTLVTLLPGAALAAGTGVISGTVTRASDGDPLEGVWVCAWGSYEDEFEEPCEETGSDGTYSLIVPEDEYRIEFWRGFESNYVAQYYEGAEFWDEADPVEVSGGQTRAGIDAALEVGASIRGTVTAADTGFPVEGAWVCADGSHGRTGCGESSSDGSYAILGLPAGDYVVQFGLGWSERFDLAPQFYDGKPRRIEATTLELDRGEARDEINAALTIGARIEGTITAAATGSPIAGLIVCAIDADEELVVCDESNLAGRYRLEGLATGAYKVVFSLDFADWYEEELSPEEDDGYLTQYYRGASSLAAATPLGLLAPGTVTGIDAALISSKTAPVLPGASVATPPLPAPNPVGNPPAKKQCRKGFKRKQVKGKPGRTRCVKVRKHKPRKGGKGRRTARAPELGRVRSRP